MCENLRPEEVRKLFNYDEISGHLTWNIGKRRVRRGDRAGTVSTQGYRVVTLNGKSYMEHHLIWVWMMGEWPSSKVDHRDRVRANNKWVNLRPASDTQNQGNRTDNADPQKTSKRGVVKKVVVRRKLDPLNPRQRVTILEDTYIARIMYKGQHIHLGTFSSEDLAHEAYKLAHLKYHGEFSIYYKAPELSQ